MLPELKVLVEDYYRVLGMTPSKSRMKEQVQARAALMTVMRNHTTSIATARAFGMDHATVLHHHRNHEGNFASWDGYKEKYELAKRMCKDVLRYKTTQAKIKSVKLEISRLQRMEKTLTDKLNSKNDE